MKSIRWATVELVILSLVLVAAILLVVFVGLMTIDFLETR